MNKKELNQFFNGITPNDEQKQKMLSRILNNKNGDLPMKRISKRFSMVAAIVALCVLTTTVALAATFNWHEMLVHYLNPSEKQMEEMSNAVNTPNATITKDGVTITVLQTITDSLDVYVLYEMTVPEWIELNDDVSWEWDYLSLKTDSNEAGVTSEQSSVILEQSGNKRTVLLHRGETAPIGNGSAKLQFETLSRYTHIYDDDGQYIDLEVEPLVEGEWNLEWVFSYEDTSKTIEPNEFVSVNGSKNTVTKIIISPMSIYIHIDGDVIVMSVRPIVNFKDDSQIVYDVRSENKSFSYGDLSGNDLYYRFDNIINPDDVESITIGDVTIPI